MTALRFLACLLVLPFFCSCESATGLLQEPFTIMGDVLNTVGRSLHVSSDKDSPKNIDAAEAQKAQVALQQNAAAPTPEQPPASTVVAR